MPAKRLRTGSALLGALAVAGMATMTVSCTSRSEKPAEPTGSRTAPVMSPTAKNGYNPITRTPQSFSPNGGGSGPVSGPNAAVPCGFGNNQCKNNS